MNKQEFDKIYETLSENEKKELAILMQPSLVLLSTCGAACASIKTMLSTLITNTHTQGCLSKTNSICEMIDAALDSMTNNINSEQFKIIERMTKKECDKCDECEKNKLGCDDGSTEETNCENNN